MCFYCGDDFTNQNDLIVHTETHGKCSDNDRALRLVKSPESEIKIDVSMIVCRLCSITIETFDLMVQHLMVKHKKPYSRTVEMMISPYRLVDLKCLECTQEFDFFSKLVTHMNCSHPRNSFPCTDCNQKFNKKRDLEAHVRAHHRKDYSCVKCQQSFTSNAALQNHRFNAHFSSCNICFKSFPTLKQRLEHMRFEHTADQTQCAFCLQTLTTKQALLRHAAKCDSKIPKTIVVSDEEKKHSIKDLRNNIATILNTSTAIPFKFYMNRFRCFYCSKDFTKCDELKQHTIIEHPLCDVTFKSMKLRNRYDGIQIKMDTSTLSCKLCYESLQEIGDLLEHLAAEHKTSFDRTVLSDIQTFKLISDSYPCPFCGEVYRYFGLLLKHISVTHTDNNFICVYCGKSFRTDPSLRAHVTRRHREGNGHKCIHCDLVFSTNASLKLHSGKAHGNKTVNCTECAEKFISQYLMQRHMISTHGKGHKCDYCGKLFIKNSFMVNHVRRLHLKEKNVECPVCFERFFDGQRLKMHMVKHAGVRNFHCDVCGKKFLWKRNLRGHMSSHTKNNPQNHT